MNLASLPRRTISLATDDGVPYASLFGPRKSPAEKERNRKRNIRKKSLRRQIAHCDKMIAILPGKRLTLVRELESLK